MKTWWPYKDPNLTDIKLLKLILQAEGIFRINGGNSQEEYVRDQLNGGVVPEGIDVHCLAGLIKVQFGSLLLILHFIRWLVLVS